MMESSARISVAIDNDA